LALANAAHAATWRFYCEVFAFWRACRGKQCRRHGRCHGGPARFLMRGLPSVSPPCERRRAQAGRGAFRRRRIWNGCCAASLCRWWPPGAGRRDQTRRARLPYPLDGAGLSGHSRIARTRPRAAERPAIAGV